MDLNMKRILTLLFLPAFFIFSGCIELNTKININPDGTGTVEETVLMSNEMIQMLNEFMTGFASDTTNPEEFKLYKEEELIARASDMGEGVNFVSGSEIKTDNKEGYKVVYSFSDLNKLKIDQSPDSRLPDDATGIEEREKKFVTFLFTKGDFSEVKIKMPDAAKDEGEAEEEPEAETETTEADEDSISENDLSQMKFFLKDLSMSLSVEVNGEITGTNAVHRDKSVITLFSINFDELLNKPEKLKELNNINPDNLKELNEVVKDIPGIKIEINDPVVINFR